MDGATHAERARGDRRALAKPYARPATSKKPPFKRVHKLDHCESESMSCLISATKAVGTAKDGVVYAPKEKRRWWDQVDFWNVWVYEDVDKGVVIGSDPDVGYGDKVFYETLPYRGTREATCEALAERLLKVTGYGEYVERGGFHGDVSHEIDNSKIAIGRLLWQGMQRTTRERLLREVFADDVFIMM